MEIYQQHFVPASKGLIKSAPSSLIPDGAFQETMNVRFGDGYVEKVKGFRRFSGQPMPEEQQEAYEQWLEEHPEGNEEVNLNNGILGNSIMYIGQYNTNDGYTFSVVHTRDGVYCLNNGYQYYNRVDAEDGGVGTEHIELEVH